MGSRGDSLLWQNTLNNLQGMAMQYGQLKQRDQMMKIESAQQLWQVGNGIYQAAKSPEAKKVALDKYVGPAIQTLNTVYGWNLPMDKLGDVLNRADDKTVGTALKELEAINQDITSGAMPREQGVKTIKDKLFSYVDYFSKDDYGSINEKGTGLLKNLETLHKRDEQFKLIEGQLKDEAKKAQAKLFIANEDEAGLRGLLETPKPKTSLVPLYGQGGEVVYQEMGAGDRVPAGYSPRPPKEPSAGQDPEKVAQNREEFALKLQREARIKAGQKTKLKFGKTALEIDADGNIISSTGDQKAIDFFNNQYETELAVKTNQAIKRGALPKTYEVPAPKEIDAPKFDPKIFLGDARDAVKKGAPKDAVIKRLKESGYTDRQLKSDPYFKGWLY